jgi:hypothetical protein
VAFKNIIEAKDDGKIKHDPHKHPYAITKITQEISEDLAA